MRWVDDDNVGLLTDLYELTMAASYVAQDMDHPASFDLFIRELPRERNFLVACGIEDALSYLEGLRFDDASISHLRSLGYFDEGFLEYLSALTFEGDVWAMAEGEAVFAHEPIIRVTAPLVQAQVAETFLLNCISFQTMIASKAARVKIACGEKDFVDFSARRDHGADASLRAARAAYIAGAAGTSNVLAGQLFEIPLSGTMAHSYVMAFRTELEAFEAFLRDFQGEPVLLIDTFDTEEGARNAVRAATNVLSGSKRLRAVRIDSGDLAERSQRVRTILDEAGFHETQIFLSGDLDEDKIQEITSAGASADGFGVGTQLGTSGDAPSLGAVYKLVAQEGQPKMKLSTGKVTLPGCKQVHRYREDGVYARDVIALEDEAVPQGGRPLLAKVMEGGRRTTPVPPLEEARDLCAATLSDLPKELLSLEPASAPYEVERSKGLLDLVARMQKTGFNGTSGQRPNRRADLDG